jgi:hypothetical protein
MRFEYPFGEEAVARFPGRSAYMGSDIGEIVHREDSRNLGDLPQRRLSLGPHAKANRALKRGFRSIL